MSIVQVDCAAGRLTFGDLAMDCTIGRGGACAAADKREGDGCTPIGTWPIRGVLLRPGKVDAAGIRLPWRWVRAGDGWSDDGADPAYNRPVRLPRAFSAESLTRGPEFLGKDFRNEDPNHGSLPDGMGGDEEEKEIRY